MATDVGAEPNIDIGRVMQVAIEVISRHALAYLGLSILVAGVPSFLFDRLSSMNTQGLFITLLAGYLLQAALIRSVILDLSNRPPEVFASLGEALKLTLPIIGILILSYLVIGVGLILLIVPGIIAYLGLIVAIPALMEEKDGVMASLHRSWELTSGSRWRILGLMAIIWIASLVLMGLGGFFGATLGADGEFSQSLGNAVTSSLSTLLLSAVSAALYVELRTVKEGATAGGLAAIFE